ncbi:MULTISPECIES: hypothetical protein [Mesorhizobium]|uniref:DUF2946 domain-containing protein n=1 Tax=Mesorhizobium denitrificans TaxID=2294114 RepID=A0A371XHT7_9HYPH|nr:MULTISPECIES: hypothetical protein [Mesorhizobium]RFC68779.1 hypothetical protein DY251_03850 [Mesorhizobium denitrificans]
MAFAQRRQVAFALVAAIVFVLQTLGSAWADHSIPMLDAFGNPLCLNNDVASGGQHDSDHSKQSDCCTAACSSWVAPALDPQSASEVLVHFREIAAPFGDDRNIRTNLLANNEQANPRAPPLAI